MGRSHRCVVSVFGDAFTLAGIMAVIWMDWRLALVSFSSLPRIAAVAPR